MKITTETGVTLLVIFLMIAWNDGALVDFRRLCQPDQQNFGFRKDPWQNEAVHYCFMTGHVNEECREISASGEFNCGEEFHLQGGLAGQKAQCCRKSGYRLIHCQTSAKTFSFRDGFDIMYVNRALRNLTSTPTSSDPTAFQVELCDLEKEESK
ncbi:uncharacterized protein LOC133188303 [Saccostrea echinata]|uniref:uncharacterized protein LOC133188303 n=1 Tax=Saccostrea echinata TaxID=191078 RepID=UPI002A7F95A6|nr:uncharacterized protein LOC133188303 [Saccostrea echinata]